MGETIFIADLHLDAGRPGIIDVARRLLAERARDADALYILGDLFEYWVGDDDPAPAMQPVIAALRRVADAGVPIFFQRGNRDFLAGETLAASCGWTLLPAMQLIDLYGRPTLILHGDQLCTGDQEHMRTREMVLAPAWQRAFLAQDLQTRHAQAANYRMQSRASTRAKDPLLMDVSRDAVAAALRETGATQMIHGHTHRPGIHEFALDGRTMRRIVLGDWYRQGSLLSCSGDEVRLESFP